MKKDAFIIKISITFFLIIGIFLTIYSYSGNSQAIKCVDGDTFAIGKTYYRLAYIDTPEKGEPGYKASSKFTCDYLNKNDEIVMRKLGKDKYNRELVVIDNDTEQDTLNNILISKCLAEPFYGKTTQNVLDLYNKCK